MVKIYSYLATVIRGEDVDGLAKFGQQTIKQAEEQGLKVTFVTQKHNYLTIIEADPIDKKQGWLQ